MTFQVLEGDVLARLAELSDESVQCVVTSPPYYGLRAYGIPPTEWPAMEYGTLGGSIAVEPMSCVLGDEVTPEAFIGHCILVFRGIRRVLRHDGIAWVNFGDSYANDGKWGGETGGKQFYLGAENRTRVGREKRKTGLKPKDLVGIPWAFAFAARGDGWWLRQDVIWAKPGPMPESVTDRCTKSHEYIFLLSKDQRYYFDNEAIKEQAVSDHPAGNTSHKGSTAYEDGDEKHRTKAGLVAFAQKSKRNSFARETKATPGEHGQKPQHRPEREDIFYAGTRNKRSVWTVATASFSEAHFATFPTKLVEPCILAGTSERGCCSSCGAPWERVTTRIDQAYDGSRYGERAVVATGGAISGGTKKSTLGSSHGKLTGKSETTGWTAGCTCGAGLIPCTILDPFNGAGTTGVVAGRLGRDYIGIELNPEYAAMSERRIIADNPMFNVKKAAEELVSAD